MRGAGDGAVWSPSTEHRFYSRCCRVEVLPVTLGVFRCPACGGVGRFSDAVGRFSDDPQDARIILLRVPPEMSHEDVLEAWELFTPTTALEGLR